MNWIDSTAKFVKELLKPKTINEIIAKLDDGKSIRFLDVGDKFVEKDGTISKDIMPDALHLSKKGYEIFAEAFHPLLVELAGLKKAATQPQTSPAP